MAGGFVWDTAEYAVYCHEDVERYLNCAKDSVCCIFIQRDFGVMNGVLEALFMAFFMREALFFCMADFIERLKERGYL